jgi:hypothetical protein
MPRTAPSNTDSVIDSRDIIERIDDLNTERAQWVEARTDAAPESEDWQVKAFLWKLAHPEDATELAALEKLAGEAEGYADDWHHGATLIRDDYFTEYARELVEDCGYISPELPHWIEIDWTATAENVRADYTAVDFDGVTYWVR